MALLLNNNITLLLCYKTYSNIGFFIINHFVISIIFIIFVYGL